MSVLYTCTAYHGYTLSLNGDPRYFLGPDLSPSFYPNVCIFVINDHCSPLAQEGSWSGDAHFFDTDLILPQHGLDSVKI